MRERGGIHYLTSAEVCSQRNKKFIGGIFKWQETEYQPQNRKKKCIKIINSIINSFHPQAKHYLVLGGENLGGEHSGNISDVILAHSTLQKHVFCCHLATRSNSSLHGFSMWSRSGDSRILICSFLVSYLLPRGYVLDPCHVGRLTFSFLVNWRRLSSKILQLMALPFCLWWSHPVPLADKQWKGCFFHLRALLCELCSSGHTQHGSVGRVLSIHPVQSS